MRREGLSTCELAGQDLQQSTQKSGAQEDQSPRSAAHSCNAENRKRRQHPGRFKQLGHYSVKLTLDTYSHWLPGKKKAEIDELDDPEYRQYSKVTTLARTIELR